MTKYVLNSGGIKRQPELKKRFHQELVKGLGDNPKLLLCNFAQGREYWNVKFQGYSDAITEDMQQGVRPSFELAMPDDFVVRRDTSLPIHALKEGEFIVMEQA